MRLLTRTEQLERDLNRCTSKSGFRPIWHISKIHNRKPKTLTERKVDKLPVFLGL